MTPEARSLGTRADSTGSRLPLLSGALRPEQHSAALRPTKGDSDLGRESLGELWPPWESPAGLG